MYGTVLICKLWVKMGSKRSYLKIFSNKKKELELFWRLVQMVFTTMDKPLNGGSLSNKVF